ncbi:chanoclavine synthase catalase protein [Epichloe bromicola]
MAVKLFTQQGNWDYLNMPMFFIRHPDPRTTADVPFIPTRRSGKLTSTRCSEGNKDYFEGDLLESKLAFSPSHLVGGGLSPRRIPRHKQRLFAYQED